MRSSVLPAILLACLTFSGCASPVAEKNAEQAPSRETTRSLPQVSAPVPSGMIGEVAAREPQTTQEVLAWAGQAPQPQAFVSATTTVGMPVPADKPLVLLTPETAAILPSPQMQAQIYGHRFRDAKPINFGSRSPRKLAVHGVDVSRWQGNIDWVKLRTQGANFAYIKATDGGDHLDPMFKTNWRKAKEAGIKRGAYHFFYWCRTAGEQADWFIRNVPREANALPPVIDVEYNGESSCKRRVSRANVLEKMQVFMDKLEAHYGKRPVIYTAPDFYKDNLKGEFLSHPFWLRSVAAHPSKVYPDRKWLFWQYSGSGLTHGVEGRIDLNVFHSTEEEWHNWVAAR